MSLPPLVPPKSDTWEEGYLRIKNLLNLAATRLLNWDYTAARPANPSGPVIFWDRSLKKLIVYDPDSNTWRDTMGTAV